MLLVAISCIYYFRKAQNTQHAQLKTQQSIRLLDTSVAGCIKCKTRAKGICNQNKCILHAPKNAHVISSTKKESSTGKRRLSTTRARFQQKFGTYGTIYLSKSFFGLHTGHTLDYQIHKMLKISHNAVYRAPITIFKCVIMSHFLNLTYHIPQRCALNLASNPAQFMCHQLTDKLPIYYHENTKCRCIPRMKIRGLIHNQAKATNWRIIL